MIRPSLVPVLGVFAAAALVASAPAAAQSSKVDLCHARGNGGYSAISVGANAAPAHLAHGDVLRPNADAPGGFVLDDACNVVTWDYAVNVVPDPAAIDPETPGDLFAGSGIPATHFGVARSNDTGIELGFMIHYRQGPNVASVDDYADGVLEFTVANGPQSTANGSFANNANRAAWNYVLSVATGLNGATTDLDDYTFQLLIDTDPGAGTSYLTLTLEAEATPQAAGQSGYQWRAAGAAISDDEGNANVTQNSQNYVFYGLPGYNAANAFPGPARFDLILQALDGNQIVVRNHIAVNVTP